MPGRPARLAKAFGGLAFYLTASLVVLFAAISANAAESNESGIRDLSNWHPLERESLRLEEGWVVVDDALIAPGAFGAGCAVVRPTQARPVSVPDLWGPAFTRSVSTGHGQKTYCIDLTLPQTTEELALHFPGVRSVFAVYAVTDGLLGPQVTLLSKNGDPAHAANETPASTQAPLAILTPDTRDVRIVVQIANYIHKQGGISAPPEIGRKTTLWAESRRMPQIAVGITIILFFLAISTHAVGWSHGHKVATFLFSALCAATAFRTLLVSDLIWDYFPDLSEALKYDLEYLSGYLVAPTYYAFASYLLRRGECANRDWVVGGAAAAFIAFAFLTPIFEPGTVTLFRELYLFICFAMSVWIAYDVMTVLRAGSKQRGEAAAIAGAMIVTLVYEISSVMEIVQIELEWSNAITLLVTAMLAWAYVLNYKQTDRERDLLNARLKSANANLENRAQTLRDAVLRAEESSRAKSEFLAMMSHELRTPLNAVIGLSEVMANGLMGPIDNPKYTEYAYDIHRSGQHLLSLVNDILDLTRVESGTDKLEEEPLDIREITEAVMRLTRPQAAKLSVHLAAEISDDLPLLLADGRKLKQILINLVSNAIKFNVPGGTVTIRCQRHEEEIALQVVDTGIGMRKEDIPKALAQFGQVDSALSRKYSGIGLGLPIVKALVEQHDGRLTLESETGKGTTASAVFPPSRWRTAEYAETPALPAKARLRSATV